MDGPGAHGGPEPAGPAGPGPFAAADATGRRSLKWCRHPAAVLPAWVAEMDVAPAEPVRAALRAAVDRGDVGYPLPGALTELPAACAAFLAGAYGWHVDPAGVHPVADVLTGVRIALDLAAPPGAAVVLPTPAYPPFFDVLGRSGRPVVEVPMVDADDGAQLDLDGIDCALRAGAAAVLLCSPQNPTGRVYRRAELAALAGTVQRRGARVVADEVHAPLTYPGHRHLPYAAVSAVTAAHTVTVTSASKGWNLPGVKCAQVILTDPRDIARWEVEVPVHEQFGASPAGIAANVAAYREGGPWLAEVRQHLDANRHLLAELLAQQLPAVPYRVPDGTYLAWLDCRALDLGGPPAAFFLDRAAVALSEGSTFGAAGTGFVRLNFATSPAVLTQIVRRMGAAVRAGDATEP
ncbi:MAG TPA: aminotransferase class I/II-fold pyridoxal phosphate-dependent enzyme [Pseudonocardia sp.]|jgi:cysteine-S-conjugate beta-lyase|nr:aminotransferase class I/II-fold pyridoxal phosphate-dependent enzyme [Pseudonocardia sp.]